MHKKSVVIVLAMAIWLAVEQRATAGTESTERLALPASSLEERLFADAADGRLDEFSPLEAALVAGGVKDADCLRRYRQKAAAFVEQLRRGESLGSKPAQRAEAIFEFMHRQILRRGYDLGHTDLRQVLDDGRFNCVSATVLFNYLAGQFGLDCRGAATPGHVVSRLVLPEGTLDVETTCPTWFRWKGDAKLSQVAPAREVSPIQLAAMIYYNRGVDLLREKRFAEAAEANAKALRLDPANATARGNLLATINNWSIELGNSRHFAEAVRLLRQGLTLDANFTPFAQNYVHVHRRWADELCGVGHFEQAIELLSRAADEMPRHDDLRQAQSDVRQRWVRAQGSALLGTAP